MKIKKMKRLTFIKTLAGALAFATTKSLAITPLDSKTIVPLEKLRKIYNEWKNEIGQNYLIIADNPEDLHKIFDVVQSNYGPEMKIVSAKGIDIHKMNNDRQASFIYFYSKDFINNHKSKNIGIDKVFIFKSDKSFLYDFTAYGKFEFLQKPESNKKEIYSCSLDYLD